MFCSNISIKIKMAIIFGLLNNITLVWYTLTVLLITPNQISVLLLASVSMPGYNVTTFPPNIAAINLCIVNLLVKNHKLYLLVNNSCFIVKCQQRIENLEQIIHRGIAPHWELHVQYVYAIFIQTYFSMWWIKPWLIKLQFANLIAYL